MTIGIFEIILITTTILELNPLLQAIKVIKLKDAKQISVFTYLLILVIGVLWLIYGINMHSIPLIIGNSVKIFACVAMIFVYIAYNKKRK
jgi:MtN3 and saliva related transmembrane protein